MPLLVRNNQAGPAVFTDFAQNIAIEWKDKDHPSGEDVLPVPESLLDHPSFIKALNTGILSIEEASPEVMERVKRQIASYQSRRKSTDEVQEDVPVIDQRGNTLLGMVSVETDKFDNDKGKAIEKDIPVIMSPREYA